MLRAYGDIFADAKFDAIVQPVARWPTRDMATRGLAGPKALLSVIIVRTLLVGPIFATHSSQGAFGARMRKKRSVRHDRSAAAGRIGLGRRTGLA